MRASNRFDIRRPAIRRWLLPISRETLFAWDVKHSITRISTIRRSVPPVFADRIFDVYWTGVKYAVTSQVDVIAAYYHYTQHSNFGTPTGGVQFCDGKEHSQCAGTLNAISGV